MKWLKSKEKEGKGKKVKNWDENGDWKKETKEERINAVEVEENVLSKSVK